MSSLALSRRARVGLVALACLTLATGAARAEAVKVMSSSGFAAALKELCAAYRQKTGVEVDIVFGPSMGDTPQAVPSRLARGEPVDVVVIAKEALDKQADAGRVVPASRVDLAASVIGMAVKAGAPKPDISTVDAFTATLAHAKSVAYSDSASGVYLSTVLFPRLDPTGALAAKSRGIPAEPVGAAVARGEADIGFQQMSELKPIKGIDIVGPIPAAVQKVTMFSAGIAANAANPAAGAALIAYLASAQAKPAIEASGMQQAAR